MLYSLARRSAREVDLEEMLEKQQETIMQVTKEREMFKQKVSADMEYLEGAENFYHLQLYHHFESILHDFEMKLVCMLQNSDLKVENFAHLSAISYQAKI